MRTSRTLRYLVVILLTLIATTGYRGQYSSAMTADISGHAPDRPIVILMIGDGIGTQPIEAASYARHGAPGKLFMQSLPHRGTLTTSGIEKVTDSAAAATAMATGVFTRNGHVGVDPDGVELENLVEWAHSMGQAAGIVTTSTLSHATPAAFTAHIDDRHRLFEIAEQQMNHLPEVMLGGGLRYLQHEEGLPRHESEARFASLTRGHEIAHDPGELHRALRLRPAGLVGVFGRQHLPYRRHHAGEAPSLAAMSRAALDVLDRDPDGFFLMIEGARIDMAAHHENLPLMVDEILQFDAAVRTVAAWAARRDNVLLLVTADHDTGALELVDVSQGRRYPKVRWGGDEHTDQPVDIFADGPGSELFDGETRDHRWIHAVASAHLAGQEIRPPWPAPRAAPDAGTPDEELPAETGPVDPIRIASATPRDLRPSGF